MGTLQLFYVSSTTARDSFHGTAISLTQHPTAEVPGADRGIILLDGTVQAQRRISKLPESFANVLPVILGVKEFVVPLVAQQIGPIICTSRNGIQKEYDWLEKLKAALGKEELDTSDFISWAAVHASGSQRRSIKKLSYP